MLTQLKRPGGAADPAFFAAPDSRTQPARARLRRFASVAWSPDKRQQLVFEVRRRLDELDRPAAGWYFERVLGPLASLSDAQLEGVLEALKTTDDVRNILSFGARDGGFELAMQIRHDFDGVLGFPKKPGPHLAHNYLDAISLQSHAHTTLAKSERVDIAKMQNPFWDIAYKNGIEHAGRMVFLVTSDWLQSAYCRQEFQWLAEAKNKGVKTAFVFFDGLDPADEMLGRVRAYAQANDSLVIDVAANDDTALHSVAVEGKDELHFRRSLRLSNLWELLEWLRRPLQDAGLRPS